MTEKKENKKTEKKIDEQKGSEQVQASSSKNVERMQELQILEQNLQQIFFQKQSFQMELSEVEAALKEIKNSGDEVYKIIGQLMIKSDKKKIKQELEQKQNLLKERVSEMEKQEEILTKRLTSLRNDVL